MGRRDALLRRAGDFDAYKLGDHLGGGDAPPLRALTHLRGSPPDGSDVEILSGVLTRHRRPINEAGSTEPEGSVMSKIRSHLRGAQIQTSSGRNEKKNMFYSAC